MSGPRIERRDDAAAAASAAAEHIAGAARRAVASRGVFTLALSGGSTPARMLAALAGMRLPWDRVQIFQVDERVAPAGDPARNVNAVREALLAPGVLPEGNLHPMPVADGDLTAAADRYAAALAVAAGVPPRLDLVHLGLGDDGHTASLVPGDAAAQLRDRDVAVTGEYRGHRRMTLTFPALDRAGERLWLVAGAGKATMLARLAAGDRSIPAGRVTGQGAVVFCDRAAAAAVP